MGSKKTVVMTWVSQGIGGSVTSTTASSADNPIAGVPASIPMITKGGRPPWRDYRERRERMREEQHSLQRGLTRRRRPPLHTKTPKDFMRTLSPMITISDSKAIAEAVVYLTEARQVTGEVLHVDGGAHAGRW